MNWRGLLFTIVGLLCWGAVAGGVEIDFRTESPATGGWSETGTMQNRDRGLKFVESGALLESPLYGGAVTSATIVTYCSGTRIDAPFTVSAGASETSFIDCGRITYAYNTYLTNVFSFGSAASIRRMRIRLNEAQEKGNYYVTSVMLKWVGGPLQAPKDVRVENVGTNAFVLRWSAPDDAECCRPLVWTNKLVEASCGESLWREGFTQAPARTGAAAAIPSGLLDGYVDSAEEARYWELDHVYPSVDAGTIRIGGTATNGWMRTPHLPRGEYLMLHLRARRQNSEDGTDLPVRRNSSGVVTDVGTVSLTDDYQDYYLRIPVLEEGDHLELHSTTNKRSTRVILDLVELISGYEAGRLEPDYLIRTEATEEECFAVENLPLGTYYFAVEARRGEDRTLSPTGRVDLVAEMASSVPPAVRFSELASQAWSWDFVCLTNLFPRTENTCVWTNGVTLVPWQAWQDGAALDKITRNKGKVANGGLYAYWATNELADTYSLGMNVGSSAKEFVCGVALTNDQRSTLGNFTLAYEGRQYGFGNKVEQVIEVEWLVTNRLVSVAVEGNWTVEERLTFVTPVSEANASLTSGEDLPLCVSVSGNLEEAVVRQGEVLLVRWRRRRVTNSAALGIDEIRLSFGKRDPTTVILIR